MDVVNGPLTTLLASALNKSATTHRKKPTPTSTTTMNEPTSQSTLANMGLLSSFSVITQSDTTKTNTLLHKQFSTDHPLTPSSSTLNNTTSSAEPASSKRKPSELKFKMESIGTQPEEDDDLDMCPARTRAVWPRQRQLVPWWQPTQPKEKPPYSYATLIAYAILISQDGRLLLSDIYRWISETYPYYILENRGWQNSIRHNLSLNKKWFLKVDRRPTQANPGKGCYWTLVPGTEQMFMENITEAGGHNRKHHDIGLTAELSMGHRNNLMVKHHYHSSSAGPRQPGSGATFSNANMKITRPEDYRQKSSASNDNKKASVKSSSAPTATPKSCKPVAAAPSLGPMYTTFRMTSTTMESVSQESQDTNQQKKMKRQCTDDDDDDLDMITTKRPKFNPTMDDMLENYLHMDAGDNQSDCDSGVDISNELLDGKKNTTTAPDCAFANQEFGLYNVLDHFLDQLPLPLEQTDSDANQFFNNLYTAQPTTGFPMNPSDIDPVVGYPSLDYYSTNGFFYDANTMPTSDAAVQGPVDGMYPTLLTSRFDPPPGDDEDTANKMATHDAAHDFRSSNNGMATNAPQPQATKGPLVIHLNGAPNIPGAAMGSIDEAAASYGLDDDMADAYLKFEEDEAVPDPTKEMMMGLEYSDITAATTDAAFGQDFLNYNFTNMCDLLES